LARKQKLEGDSKGVIKKKKKKKKRIIVQKKVAGLKATTVVEIFNFFLESFMWSFGSVIKAEEK
jgi:hypothetical protein